MVVRHGGREVLYDRSSDQRDAVHWAAFFSDCEHEVLEVTRGHRVSFTYNSYWTECRPSLMGDNFEALNKESLHFYGSLQRLLACSSFLPDGAYSFPNPYPLQPLLPA